MTYRLSAWLGEVLRAWGLQVQETPGWRDRGHGDAEETQGVLCHHTGGAVSGNMSSLNTVIHGRSDLAGPLCNLALGRDGTYFLVAAGKAWHAGRGMWHGVGDANAHFVGIEAENTGEKSDPWPDAQMDAYRRGVAAILTHIGAKPIMAAGHREYALPRGRKDDPSFDMDKFRADVESLMEPPKAKALRDEDSARGDKPFMHDGDDDVA